MSLRVEKIEPIGSTKSSTHKKNDPYRFWRARIASQQSKQQSQSAQSFQDVLASAIEDSETVQKLSETKKKWEHIKPFYLKWSTLMKNKTFNILSIIFSLLFLLITGTLVVTACVSGVVVMITLYTFGCNIFEVIFSIVPYLVFCVIPGVMFAGCWMAFCDFLKSLIKWWLFWTIVLRLCSGREKFSSLALSPFIWHEKRLSIMKFSHFVPSFSSLLS